MGASAGRPAVVGGPASWRRGLARALLGVVLTVLAPGPAAAQSASPRKVAEALARVYGANLHADTLVIEGATIYRVVHDGALLGYAQVRNVKGKDQPITFLVATDSTLHLRDIDILVYREAYGGEVAYEPWRRQFRGKGPGDRLKPDADIRGISGATISVHAVTSAVRRTLQDFLRWRDEGRL
jgi:Na+-translocating ferredoxin:NAD+ oxidoreductase RnfG subunit